MDARITKKRLGHMLSYDWLKIVALAVGVVILWVLLFQMLATRATIGQTFYIYTYYDTTARNEKVNELSNLKAKGALSYDVLEVTDSALSNNEYLSQMLAAYMAAQQGDVFFITDVVPEDEEETKSSESANGIAAEDVKYSNWQSFISGGYYSAFARLGDEDMKDTKSDGKANYFDELEKYLNKFYSGDFKSGSLDEDAVETTFRSRMKKDKRYKTEKQIKAGIADEITRIESLKKSYERVKKALEADIISIKPTKIANDSNNDGIITDDEWITLCRGIDISKIERITDFIVNTDGSADGLTMAIFDWANYQYHLQFEPITYLDFIITAYGGDEQLNAIA